MTKTILITGATDGIGLLKAETLASAGHKVRLHGRSEEKLVKAAAEVGGTSETYRADLSKMDDVQALAKAVKADHETLDVVINNAGVLKLTDAVTEDGYDARFMVNTFAPYVLTQALLPILASDGRVVNLSSAAQAPVDIDALHGRKPLDDMGAYAQSKLAITIWRREMAKPLRKTQVAVICRNSSQMSGAKRSWLRCSSLIWFSRLRSSRPGTRSVRRSVLRRGNAACNAGSGMWSGAAM